MPFWLADDGAEVVQPGANADGAVMTKWRQQEVTFPLFLVSRLCLHAVEHCRAITTVGCVVGQQARTTA
jgi:hypothetical protein